MAMALGPIFAAGGFQAFSSNGYTLLFLPDIANLELQAAGQSPVYYWLPNKVRLARKDGDGSDYVFSLVRFTGAKAEGDAIKQTAGGVFAFSTTSAPPAAELKDIQDQLLAAFKGKDDKYWGWRTDRAPEFRPAPIVANTTTVSNMSSLPDPNQPAAPTKSLKKDAPPLLSTRARPAPATKVLTTYKGDVDPMYMRVDEVGPGSVSPFAENAYSGIAGPLASQILWASFHNSSSVITVHQYMRIKVVSPEVTLHMKMHFDRVQAHLSADVHYNGVFWSGDVKAQFNYMLQQGMIESTLFVDTTLPNFEKLQEAIEKRSDLVFQKFMEIAMKTIFDPAPFSETPADSGTGVGLGVALKLRADVAQVNVEFKETRQFAYFQDYPISGDLSGIADEIKADPSAEKKYFTQLYLGDLDRYVARTLKPVVNWGDPARKWVGQPVAFLSAQVGYPNEHGEIGWEAHLFQSSDPPDAHWTNVIEQKKAADVTTPPEKWSPDKTFIKRRIHFTEPPNADEYPYARVQVEKNIVELDAGDYGTLTNDGNLEIRVESTGTLSVGPISLGARLTDDTQVVEVEIRALGKRDDGQDRTSERFQWNFADQHEARHFMVYTGQPGFVPKYEYCVSVTLLGTPFRKPVRWTGPWVQTGGNGPVLIDLPMQGDPGVTTKTLPVKEHGPALVSAPAPAATPSAGSGRTPPPKSVPQDAPATVGGFTYGTSKDGPNGGVVRRTPTVLPLDNT